MLGHVEKCHLLITALVRGGIWKSLQVLGPVGMPRQGGPWRLLYLAMQGGEHIREKTSQPSQEWG